jgi:hypothetical protein
LNRGRSTLSAFQWFLGIVLGAAFSVGLTLLGYHWSATPIFREPIVAATVGVVLGFPAGIVIVADIVRAWHDRR